MVIKAVLFDLDGTFADTAPDLAAALNHARARRNLPPLPIEVLRPQCSHGSRGLLKTGFDIEPGIPTTTRCATSSSIITQATSVCIRDFSAIPQN